MREIADKPPPFQQLLQQLHNSDMSLARLVCEWGLSMLVNVSPDVR